MSASACPLSLTAMPRPLTENPTIKVVGHILNPTVIFGHYEG